MLVPPGVALVVVGASLGGVSALGTLLAGLTRALPVPMVLVQHLAPSPSLLAELLARHAHVPVVWATGGLRPVAGTVYVCPPHHHVRLVDGFFEVGVLGEHGSAGQIDGLLVSAAQAFGTGVLAVVLTGLGHDGTAGALAVKAAGGTVIVQDAGSSKAFAMPSSVIDAGAADLVLSLAEIGALLEELAAAAQPG